MGVIMFKKPESRSYLKGLVVFLAFLCYITPVAGNEEVSATAEYSKGAKQCMSCHREGRDREAHEIFLTPMGISGDPDSPFANENHDCEACHGPSASHRKKQKDGSRLSPGITYDGKTPVSLQNETCMSCHNDSTMMHWTGSMHDEEEVACASCHEVHAQRDPAFDKLAQQEKCFACHPRTRSDTFKNSSHPLRFGQMTCSDCHNAHAGNNDFLLTQSTVNDTCYTCHAEKRGPFLWEHAPVTEDCSLCHNSHGSNHAALLKQRSPLLCQQCHSPSGHPTTAYTSELQEESVQQKFLLARSCANCHSQVHGSNHPSGEIITR
jgi:DmsE family decaheme c-type cytochrome